jgi:hypothetical protein
MVEQTAVLARVVRVVYPHFFSALLRWEDLSRQPWYWQAWELLYPFLLVLAAALLAWALPMMAISLATGREAFMLPAATAVDAEPLPNARASDGCRPAEMALEILYDARSHGLNHSLYNAPEVRDRIAAWLREQAGAPAVKREAEEGWG